MRQGRFLALGWVLLMLTGCPEVGRITYRFDLSKGEGSLSFEDIGTDDPSTAAGDFSQIVNDWVLGSKVQEQHPAWRVGERKLVEREGQLDGLVLFSFARTADAGLFQYDKKSALLWCGGEKDKVLSTNGTVVPQYPNCVMFDRKIKLAEVTVTGSPSATHASLVEQFRAWDGGPLADTSGLGGLSGMVSDVVKGALTGETPPDGSSGFDLGNLLPTAEAGAAWTSLGLPVAGGKVVMSDETHFQVAHGGISTTEALSKYGDALRGAGYAFVSQGADEAVWSKGTDKLTVVATQAGGTVIVSVAR